MKIKWVDKFEDISYTPSDHTGFAFKEGKTDDEIVPCRVIDAFKKSDEIEYMIPWGELKHNMWKKMSA